jgi:hypothetical protein
VYHAGVTARWLLCATLILAFVVFDFEGVRHSVHHLGSPDSGCPMASAAADVQAVSPGPIVIARAAPDLLGAVPALDLPRLSSRALVHHRGRAPPASLLA